MAMPAPDFSLCLFLIPERVVILFLGNITYAYTNIYALSLMKTLHLSLYGQVLCHDELFFWGTYKMPRSAVLCLLVSSTRCV